MGALYAALLLLLLLTGACGKKVDTPQQEACCAALLLEGPVGSKGHDGKYQLPVACRDLVGCPSLGFSPQASEHIDIDPASETLRQQSALREDPSCTRAEWEGRCPPSSTMLLASRMAGSCIAEGCVHRETQSMAGEDEDELLRVITSEVTQRLQAEKRNMTKSFYAHVRGLRRSFGKAQKRWSREVTQAMKATKEIDMKLLRSLTEVAMMKGFRGGKLEEVIAAVEKYDSQQAGVALMSQAVASEDATVKNAGTSILRTPVEITQRHQHVACLLLEEDCASSSLPSNVLGADEAASFIIAVVLMVLVKRWRRGGRFIEDQVCNEGRAHEDADDEGAATAAAQEAAAEKEPVDELEKRTSTLRSWNALLAERAGAAERTVAKIRREATRAAGQKQEKLAQVQQKLATSTDENAVLTERAAAAERTVGEMRRCVV
ncbi:hypothetical protein Esi_0615_0001 [Ectocarpus siliculosus]|uniref:Uncharacterized protein n=1 Tax=Ectocarpus siliculosus TaxID=2880 RepID=D7G532_ECTSI|nr:hypothetical protein Esi_0615_0001 [Ectocarpus siliculosus]|eukprot:CBJ33795.1 hypothetical protein Esi_0615_0001 [Ectocarpus siliculosus]